MPMYSLAIKVVLDRDLFMGEAALWKKAVYKWLHVFDTLGFPSMLGHALLSEQVSSLGGAQSMVLHDAPGVKSPRTAIKRAQTLLGYFSQFQPNGQDWEPWDRSMCLQYMGYLGNRVQAASRGITLLEALRFSKYFVDLPIPEVRLSDPPLRGREHWLVIVWNAWQPARPLEASELTLMEKVMDSGLDTRDVYLLSALIFAVLSRSRWSDLRYVEHFWVERAEFKVGPSGFVDDFGAFIYRLLMTGLGNSISLHSCGRTNLVWCSACGLDETPSTLLRYHELLCTKSMAVYSWDELAWPLQLCCSMLVNIRKDRFRPDESAQVKRIVTAMGLGLRRRSTSLVRFGKIGEVTWGTSALEQGSRLRRAGS